MERVVFKVWVADEYFKENEHQKITFVQLVGKVALFQRNKKAYRVRNFLV